MTSPEKEIAIQPVVQTTAVGHRNPEGAPRPEHPIDFPYGLPTVRKVLQCMVANHHVHGFLAQGNRTRVSQHPGPSVLRRAGKVHIQSQDPGLGLGIGETPRPRSQIQYDGGR